MLGGHHEEKMTNSLLNMLLCTVVNARVLFFIKVEFIINTTATNILKAYTKLGGWILMHKNRQLSIQIKYIKLKHESTKDMKIFMKCLS